MKIYISVTTCVESESVSESEKKIFESESEKYLLGSATLLETEYFMALMPLSEVPA
jgi:hypothetical protein